MLRGALYALCAFDASRSHCQSLTRAGSQSTTAVVTETAAVVARS